MAVSHGGAVLITGGSSGIGKETALALGRSLNARVTIVDLENTADDAAVTVSVASTAVCESR
jgi:NAD(P)-dependent dehydrogenase (short-subunit alcohol dehydrogenase family)